MLASTLKLSSAGSVRTIFLSPAPPGPGERNHSSVGSRLSSTLIPSSDGSATTTFFRLRCVSRSRRVCSHPALTLECRCSTQHRHMSCYLPQLLAIQVEAHSSSPSWAPTCPRRLRAPTAGSCSTSSQPRVVQLHASVASRASGAAVVLDAKESSTARTSSCSPASVQT